MVYINIRVSAGHIRAHQQCKMYQYLPGSSGRIITNVAARTQTDTSRPVPATAASCHDSSSNNVSCDSCHSLHWDILPAHHRLFSYHCELRYYEFLGIIPNISVTDRHTTQMLEFAGWKILCRFHSWKWLKIKIHCFCNFLATTYVTCVYLNILLTSEHLTSAKRNCWQR